jgi:23S rRNA (guanosine2251-2'-O)-methyltransferase
MKEWIVGRNPVYEVLTSGRRQVFRLHIARGVEDKGRLADLIDLAQKKHLTIERVDRAQLNPYGENPQGVAVEVSRYPYMDIQDIFNLAEQRQEPLFVLILDVIQDPQNLGTLLRTAEAVGVNGVLMPLRRAAEVTPAVVRASAGASEHLIITQANLAQAIMDSWPRWRSSGRSGRTSSSGWTAGSGGR